MKNLDTNFGDAIDSQSLISQIAIITLRLFAFCTPWGIYRFKRMVQGATPPGSETQKKIRETIKSCKNSLNIKDDILVYGKGLEHDYHLDTLLKTV